MKLYTAKISLIFLFLLSVIACEVDREDPKPSKLDNLTSRAYKLVRMDFPGTSVAVKPLCKVDDTFRFEPNFVYKKFDNLAKCTATDSVYVGKYYLTEDETKLIINGATYDITMFTTDSLKLTRSYSGVSGTVIQTDVYTNR